MLQLLHTVLSLIIGIKILYIAPKISLSFVDVRLSTVNTQWILCLFSCFRKGQDKILTRNECIHPPHRWHSCYRRCNADDLVMWPVWCARVHREESWRATLELLDNHCSNRSLRLRRLESRSHFLLLYLFWETVKVSWGFVRAMLELVDYNHCLNWSLKLLLESHICC